MEEETMTIEQLETKKVVTLETVTDVNGADLAAPSPTPSNAPTLTSKINNHVVGASSISPITAQELTKTREYLANDHPVDGINATFASLEENTRVAIGGLISKLDTLRTEAEIADKGLKDSTNKGFSEFKAELDTQVQDIQTELGNIVQSFNNAVSEISSKNVEQNSTIASQMNIMKGVLTNNINAVLSVANDSQNKLASLDNVMNTDANFLERVALVDKALNVIKGIDFSFLTAFDTLVDEVNAIIRLRPISVTMANANGIYDFNMRAEGLGEFDSVNDWEAMVQVVDSLDAEARIINSTKDGFKIMVRSYGLHALPQPVDGSATPVTLTVKVSHEKRNMLSMNVDTLQDSWVAGSNTIGAGNDTAPTA